jgi:hypothetical protein
MFSDDLYSIALVQPSRAYDDLKIVTGYASPSMVTKHLTSLSQEKYQGNVEIIIGMTAKDGLQNYAHKAFNQLVSRKGNFFCNYMVKKPVHAKLFIWMKDGQPKLAFIGSSNYSQNGFCGGNFETIDKCDPINAFQVFSQLKQESISCDQSDVASLVNIKKRAPNSNISQNSIAQYGSRIRLSLLDSRSGRVHEKSGLNWGQRQSREKNQAYIPVSTRAEGIDLLPPRFAHFTIVTDDDVVLNCVRAQDNGKAIETYENNSILGEYFRDRLNVPKGAYVYLEDLERYGRTTVDLYKIDDYEFFMDFSVPQNA